MLEDYSFAMLPVLEVLHLHHNIHLKTLNNETFNETYNIKYLTIYSNNLTEIPGKTLFWETRQIRYNINKLNK